MLLNNRSFCHIGMGAFLQPILMQFRAWIAKTARRCPSFLASSENRRRIVTGTLSRRRSIALATTALPSTIPLSPIRRRRASRKTKRDTALPNARNVPTKKDPLVSVRRARRASVSGALLRPIVAPSDSRSLERSFSDSPALARHDGKGHRHAATALQAAPALQPRTRDCARGPMPSS
jgi:hypothetical protein